MPLFKRIFLIPHGFRKMLPALLILWFVPGQKLAAQSIAGLTHQRDTSYTTWSAYLSSRKAHPDIRIAAQAHYSDVKFSGDIFYCTVGRRPLKLDVFQPTSAEGGKRVAVLIIHGGGWRSGERSQHYALAEELAHRGYVCFTPEYRLSTEALFPAAVYDIKAAIRFIRKEAALFNIDTAKITALGFSAGGELAAFMGSTGNMPLCEGCTCATGYSSAVNAVVDIDGILSFVHPESREGDDRKKTSAATYWFGYSRKEKEKLWEAASTLSYAGAQSPPTLFLNSSVAGMHAGRDDYRRILDSCGIYSELHSFDKAPHSFCLFDPWFQPTVNYIDQFLRKIFKP